MPDDPTLPGTGAFTQAPEVPLRIAGRYDIVRWLGGGGMGRVYEVHDTELDERVALKVLHAGLTDVELERFRREVKVTRRIVHRNVARMFDIGEHAGERFLTMELVDGASLTRLVATSPPPEQIRDIARQICAGLAAAHAAGVVHRDLKPDNVLIERGTARVVLADFGIAWSAGAGGLTQVGLVIGTPRYMAPEQLAGRDIDPRADLFSLGVMLYELATGERPWTGNGPIELAVAQVTTPPKPMPSGVPADLAAVIAACLAVERDDRPASAELVAQMLDAAATIPARAVARPVPRNRTTITVLPYRCAPADQHLADWLQEELADTLSMTPELRVRPAHAGVVVADPRDVGRALGVDHVVEGSVRRLATGVRVASRLVGVADGFQIWARRYDFGETDVLAAADQIAREIADALSSTAAAPATPPSPMTAETIELYLRARSELRRFWGEHANNAALLLERALAGSPESPELVGAYALATTQAWARSGEPEHKLRAQHAVERAVALKHGEALAAVGSLRLNEGDVEAGVAALAAALVRAPMSAPVHESIGRLMLEIDRVAEGFAHYETARGLDPGRAKVLEIDLARADGLAGAWGAAEQRIAALCADPDPEVVQLGAIAESRLAAWYGDRDRTLAAARRLGARMDERTSMYGLLARAIAGERIDRGRWTALVGTLAPLDKPRRAALGALQRAAEIAFLAGEPDLAVDTVEHAISLGLTDLVWFDRCPLLAPMRASVRGAALRDPLAARATRVSVALDAR